MNYGPYQKFEDSSCTMFMTEAPSSLCQKNGGFWKLCRATDEV
jgi:hypothetical protein